VEILSGHTTNHAIFRRRSSWIGMEFPRLKMKTKLINIRPIKDIESRQQRYEVEIPENSQIMQRFKRNHPRLYQWYHTRLGKKYLEQQRGEE